MYYLSNADENIGFKVEGIHEILSTDVKISDELYAEFFEMQNAGNQYAIKNIDGTTFEEIFEVVAIITTPLPPSELEILQAKFDALEAKTVANEGAIDFIIMNF